MKDTYYTSVPIIIKFCFEIGLLLRLLRKSTTNTKNKYKGPLDKSMATAKPYPLVIHIGSSDVGNRGQA